MLRREKTATPDGVTVFWWRRVDSNHRSETQQIYSLPPLATRELLHMKLSSPLKADPKSKPSGIDLEKRHSVENELSCPHGSMESKACVDVELVDGFEPPTC